MGGNETARVRYSTWHGRGYLAVPGAVRSAGDLLP